MCHNWKETTLGEVAEDIAYGYTESASIEPIGPKFLRITDIQDDFINWDSVPYCPISEKDHKKYKLEIGDVVIARTGNSTGATATIKKQVDAVFASYLIRFKIDAQKANYLFIDFLLRSNYWKAFVKSVKGGSAQGGANAKNFAEFPIFLPPLPEQKAIAAILSSFDDKIELLRRQNKTLEQIAQTIFKEWFIIFKVNGKKQKVNSSSGLPEGWRVGNLGDILELIYGKALKEEERTGKGYPVIGSSGIVGYHSEYLAESFGIVVGRKGSMGTVIWIEDKFFPIDTTFYVVDRLGVKDLFFHYFVLENIDFQRIGSDSAVPGLNRTLACSLELVIPKKEVVEEYNKTVEPIFQKMKNNNSQIQTLSKLRDTLLPKLMKGEIRVKNVEMHMENKL